MGLVAAELFTASATAFRSVAGLTRESRAFDICVLVPDGGSPGGVIGPCAV